MMKSKIYNDVFAIFDIQFNDFAAHYPRLAVITGPTPVMTILRERAGWPSCLPPQAVSYLMPRLVKNCAV
jgi:hypothetical protein